MYILHRIATYPCKKWTEDIGRLTCCLLNTLDYCLLESNNLINLVIKEIKFDDLKLQVSLEPSHQKILINKTIGMNVIISRFFDQEIQVPFQQFVKTDWEKVMLPMDPSPFYLKIVESLEQNSKFTLQKVLNCLNTKLCETFLEKFIR